MGGVYSDQVIGDGACFGGPVEVIVVAAGSEVFQPVADGTVGQRGDPQAEAGLAATEIAVDIAVDGFTLAPGIGRHDDAVGTVKDLPDDLQLLEHAGIGFVFLSFPYLPGYVLELLRQDGQVLPAESCKSVGFGQVHNSEHPHPVFPPQLASFEL